MRHGKESQNYGSTFNQRKVERWLHPFWTHLSKLPNFIVQVLLLAFIQELPSLVKQDKYASNICKSMVDVVPGNQGFPGCWEIRQLLNWLPNSTVQTTSSFLFTSHQNPIECSFIFKRRFNLDLYETLLGPYQPVGGPFTIRVKNIIVMVNGRQMV